MNRSRAYGLVLAALAVLAVLPYLRALALPLMSDDYLQVGLGRRWGSFEGWPELARDALYRCRATSLVLTHWTEQIFGFSPLLFNLSSLALHVLNTWLVFALGVWRPMGWRIAALAAAFFAVYEGHQEAVIWYSALPELLVFTFSLAALICWILWLQGSGRVYAAAAFAAFLLALFSKESAAAVVGLLLLPVWQARVPLRRWLAPWLAFAAIAAVYAASIYAARTGHLHFNDGTFSLSAPVALVMANSLGRMLWFWGALALLVLVVRRAREWKTLLALAAGWAVIALLPYSFLTYMPRVPSRHTYLASVALGWLIAAAALVLWQKVPRRACWALATVLVLHNCGYIWTRKHAQYVARAEPTEKLLAFARATRGPVYVHCFSYGIEAAEWALRVTSGRDMIYAPRGNAPGPLFCLSPEKHHIPQVATR